MKQNCENSSFVLKLKWKFIRKNAMGKYEYKNES